LELSGKLWVHTRIVPTAESGLHTELIFGKGRGKVVPVLSTGHHAMKAYWGVEIKPHTLLTSALNGDEWPTTHHRPPYPQGKKAVIWNIEKIGG
jgi:hypothetical protein